MRFLILNIWILAMAATGCSRSTAEPDLLSGSITLGGAPVKNVTVVATNPDGGEASALADETGHYRMENPPKGFLKFRIAGFAPPPPPLIPGEAAVVAPIDRNVPSRYQQSNNELQFEFSGGNQTYNIQLIKR